MRVGDLRRTMDMVSWLAYQNCPTQKLSGHTLVFATPDKELDDNQRYRIESYPAVGDPTYSNTLKGNEVFRERGRHSVTVVYGPNIESRLEDPTGNMSRRIPAREDAYESAEAVVEIFKHGRRFRVPRYVPLFSGFDEETYKTEYRDDNEGRNPTKEEILAARKLYVNRILAVMQIDNIDTSADTLTYLEYTKYSLGYLSNEDDAEQRNRPFVDSDLPDNLDLSFPMGKMKYPPDGAVRNVQKLLGQTGDFVIVDPPAIMPEFVEEGNVRIPIMISYVATAYPNGNEIRG